MGTDLWQCALMVTLLCCPTGKPGNQHPDTEPTSPCPIPIMPSTWLGNDKCPFYKALVWLDYGFETIFSRMWDKCSIDSATAPGLPGGMRTLYQLDHPSRSHTRLETGESIQFSALPPSCRRHCSWYHSILIAGDNVRIIIMAHITPWHNW